MAKLNTRIRYLCQDKVGAIHASISDPVIRHNEWMYCDWYFFCDGKENPNWRDTLIDLDKDDYEFEDGILRRIEK